MLFTAFSRHSTSLLEASPVLRLDAMWQAARLERATGDPFVFAPFRVCLAVPVQWLSGTNRGAQSSAAVRDCRKWIFECQANKSALALALRFGATGR